MDHHGVPRRGGRGGPVDVDQGDCCCTRFVRCVGTRTCTQFLEKVFLDKRLVEKTDLGEVRFSDFSEELHLRVDKLHRVE